MNLRISVAVPLLALTLVSAAQIGKRLRNVQSDVPFLLIRAIRAQPTLRYTGEYTVEFKQAGSAVRHKEDITRDGSRYRIDFPAGSQFVGQVIVEDQKVRLHYRPGPNEIIQQPPRHGEAWEKIANLATDTHVSLSVVPGDMIAGLKTDELVVADKSGNVLQRLYIEPISGVIMKRQIFDLVGAQQGFFEFNQINLSPKIDPSDFVIKRKNAKLITPAMQLARVSMRRGFMYRMLSPSTGFVLEGVNPKMFAGVEGLVQTYVDGRNRLFAYILKAPVDPNRLRQNARNTHFFSWQNNGETIVLLGNLDERTLERYAGMMTPGTPSPAAKL